MNDRQSGIHRYRDLSQIIDVPKEGLLDVLRSCSKIRKQKQKLKCFVQTSSIAAICDKTKPLDYEFTEDDWNDSATLKTSPYDTAKTAAERALMEYMKDLPEDESFRVVSGTSRSTIGEQASQQKYTCLHNIRAFLSGPWRAQVVINPSLVLGPALAPYQAKQSSLQLIFDMVAGSMSRPPAFHFPTVHIDDVALMHVKAIEMDSLTGRYM